MTRSVTKPKSGTTARPGSRQVTRPSPESVNGVDLETCTAEVSSNRQVPISQKASTEVPKPPKPKLRGIETGGRKDSAVHVSLSSDLLVKQPGTRGPTGPGTTTRTPPSRDASPYPTTQAVRPHPSQPRPRTPARQRHPMNRPGAKAHTKVRNSGDAPSRRGGGGP